MGAFRARAAVSRDESADIGRFSPNADQSFDLMLDLSRTPLFAQEMPPLGYFAPGDDAHALDHALATLPTLVGRFAKPRYFDYSAELCTHGTQGLAGCTRCLEVCSTSAISSAGDVISVDPYLCQGCATCMLACPTGALAFKPAPRETLLAHVAQAIADAHEDAVTNPVLIIRTGGSDVGNQSLPASARPIDVPVVPAFGDELWFAALAQGAAGVVLVDDESAPARTREILAQRVASAREILTAAGAQREAIALAPPERLAQHVAAAAANASPHARVSKPNPRATKRALTLAAIDTLTSGYAMGPHSLASDAPFGDVVVDRTKCTVCRACVNICPTGALLGTAEPLATLSFIEANCVQCGLCEAGCPEDAITLQPRFVADVAARNAARVLHEDELARCTSCGTPFIAASLLAASLARMRDFPGLASSGGIERLKLCPACRQRESLTPGE
jgi:ferredoxin